MFTIGCDPEFFLEKNGKPFSAIGLIGGTKEAPKPLRKKGLLFKKIMLLLNSMFSANSSADCAGGTLNSTATLSS